MVLVKIQDKCLVHFFSIVFLGVDVERIKFIIWIKIKIKYLTNFRRLISKKFRWPSKHLMAEKIAIFQEYG